jgi:cobaltochelatase CobS
MEKVACEICGHEDHAIEHHLRTAHKLDLAEYQKKYPAAKTLSKYAISQIEQRIAALKNDSPCKVGFDIKNTFGHIFPFQKEVSGFTKPWESTPVVDPDYVFDKGLLQTVLFSISNPAERMLLTGPTGSGKSSVVQQVVARLNLPFTRINCDGDLTRADFIGQMVLDKDGAMVFQYGPLPTAMMEGRVLLIDEWDSANPSVAMALQSVLEEDGKLTITENNEVIKPHPDFRVFATSNTKGQGDDSGMYHGTQPQNYAALDRFTVVDIVDYPTAGVEKKIVSQKTGIKNDAKDKVLDKLIQMANLVRKAFKAEDINCTMSTRTVVNVARKLMAFGDLERAYEVAFFNKCSEDDNEVVRGLFQRVWG